MDNNCPQEGQQLERVATTHMTIQIAENKKCVVQHGFVVGLTACKQAKDLKLIKVQVFAGTPIC